MGSILNSDAEQISPLPTVKRYITAHDPVTAISRMLPDEPLVWNASLALDAAACVAYTTSEFPPNLSNDDDLKKFKETIASGKLGLVNHSGTVCRVVDFAPGREAIMHRTKSLDYGILLEGVVEMVLDSGDRCTLHRGDIVVQRATMHGWRNASTIEWARMLFVLQECEELKVGNLTVVENLEAAKGTFLDRNIGSTSVAKNE